MPCAANYVRCVLSVMYTKAVEWEARRCRNPVTPVEKFKERAVERFLDPDERQALERVLAAAEHIPSGQPGHIGREAIWAVRLLALTGMRRDEVRDLRWEMVDWRQGTLHLPETKTGKRDIVVSDEVMEVLAKIAAEKGKPKRGLVVCSSRGKRLWSLCRSWKHARKLAGIPDVRLHDLRHSVASDAIMNGVPLEVVGKMLGHKNYRTTQRYAHIADYVLRDAVNLTSKTIVRAGQHATGPSVAAMVEGPVRPSTPRRACDPPPRRDR
jgi:integrase